MATYRVLIPWTNAEGEHAPGDTVELDAESSAERVELDRLITYGIVEPASSMPDSDTTTPPRRSRK